MLTDGRTDGRKVITIAHPEQSSGELRKKTKKQKKTKNTDCVKCIVEDSQYTISKIAHAI